MLIKFRHSFVSLSVGGIDGNLFRVNYAAPEQMKKFIRVTDLSPRSNISAYKFIGKLINTRHFVENQHLPDKLTIKFLRFSKKKV